MNKKYLVIGLILLGLAVAGGGFLWWTMRPSDSTTEPTPTQGAITEPVKEAGSKKEEIPSEPKITDEESIAEAFAEKYIKPIEEVNITINQKAEPFARGGVAFTGEMGGAMWLAYKEGNDWLIVFDGQGTIPCSAIEPYDFPIEMASECWDEVNNKLIKRE